MCLTTDSGSILNGIGQWAWTASTLLLYGHKQSLRLRGVDGRGRVVSANSTLMNVYPTSEDIARCCNDQHSMRFYSSYIIHTNIM